MEIAKDRIAALYQLLDCNNLKIARAAGYSASEITKLRNGNRAYKPTSRPVLRFAEGIYNYADMIGAVKPLCTLCGAEGQGREDVIPALAAWLFGRQSTDVSAYLPMVAKSLRTAKEKKRRSLGEKLGAVMDLLEVSNSRLAAQISVDSSTIRRFRSGIRSPKPPIDQLLVSALMDRAQTQDARQKLAKLCGIPAESIDEKALSAWLFEGDGEFLAYSFSYINDLLDTIEGFPIQRQPALLDPGSFVTGDILNSTQSIYWGVGGLREAVIRFLATALREGGELLLYSDQDLNWMVGDSEFRVQWASLMAACVQSGVQIRIIHNMDRDNSEMLSAIQSWLPLYMSGMIKPFVCQLGIDNRFSKTIFLRPDGACILASCLRGHEDQGRYEYITDQHSLSNAAAEFDRLLENCIPLVNIYLDAAAVPFEANESANQIRLLMPNPSLASMPEETLRSILARSKVSGADRSRIEHAHSFQVEWLKKRLESGQVCEFVTLPSDELLFTGAVRVNLPQSLYDGELFYTPEEFAAHAKAIIALIQDHANYDVVLLPEQPFAQIQIVAMDTRVSVIRIGKPYIDFVFSERRLVKAFQDYFDLLTKQYRTDRKDVQNRLMRFI